MGCENPTVETTGDFIGFHWPIHRMIVMSCHPNFSLLKCSLVVKLVIYHEIPWFIPPCSVVLHGPVRSIFFKLENPCFWHTSNIEIDESNSVTAIPKNGRFPFRHRATPRNHLVRTPGAQKSAQKPLPDPGLNLESPSPPGTDTSRISWPKFRVTYGGFLSHTRWCPPVMFVGL